MFFPFDEKSIKHIKIRVGGTVLLKQFLLANDRYHAFRRKNTKIVPLKTYRFYFQIVASNDNKSPIHSILRARIGLAAALFA